MMDLFKQELIEIAKKLENSDLTSFGPGKGSISARCENGNFLITPSGKDFSELDLEDIVEVNQGGEPILDVGLKPSLDLIFHKCIYDARGDVNAIIHTHSPYATTWACINEPIKPMIVALMLMVGGEVSVAPFAFPQSPELGENVVRELNRKNAVLMQNHGVICVGKNLRKALSCAGTVENVAKIQAISSSIGTIKPLSPKLAEKALEMETNYQ